VDAVPAYSCPVRRHNQIVVSLVAVAIACGVGIFFTTSSTYGGAFAAATLITGVALFGGLAIVLSLFTPTHIEVGEDLVVRLVAPRTQTTYDPETVVVQRSPTTGTFAFGRAATGRVLARFVPPNPEAAVEAFTAAGVRVVP
jgi:hypothetical protein